MRSIKLDRHFLIKTGMVLFLVFYIAALCLSDYAKDVPMDRIQEGMEKLDSVTELPVQDRKALRRFYQIDDSSVEGYVFHKAASPMAVEEIIIVKASSKSQKESLLAAANGHLKSQKNIFEGYGTDQMALLKEAIVESKGNYVYYMCGRDARQWKQALLAMI